MYHEVFEKYGVEGTLTSLRRDTAILMQAILSAKPEECHRIAHALHEYFAATRNLALVGPLAAFGANSRSKRVRFTFIELGFYTSRVAPFDEASFLRIVREEPAGLPECRVHIGSRTLVEVTSGEDDWKSHMLVRHGRKSWTPYPREVFEREFTSNLVLEQNVRTPYLHEPKTKRIKVGNEMQWVFAGPSLTSHAFSSELVNEQNLALDEEQGWEEIVLRVASGKKPIAINCNTLSLSAANVAQLRKLTAGRRIKISHSGTHVSRKGPLSELFDLHSLQKDYENALLPMGESHLVLGLQLLFTRMQELRLEDYNDFVVVDTNSNHDPRLYARTGLLFGYPIESSLALICSAASVPKCHYRIERALEPEALEAVA